MDKATLRKLNKQLINAEARLARAQLAFTLADTEAQHLRKQRTEALAKFRDQLTSPLYDVYIAGFSDGAHKIQCIKAVRELSSLGLREAKDVVDRAGQVKESTFLKGVDFAQAERARKMLRECGGIVELREAQ